MVMFILYYLYSTTNRSFFQEYQKEHETAYLFITHNKVLAKTVCDEIYEIREGICTKKEM